MLGDCNPPKVSEERQPLAAMLSRENTMAFTDQLKAALAKKQTAQHPDQKTKDENLQKKTSPVVSNKPQKKAAGRGR
jgi:hypothetical protein